jgi:hypothetical protein
MEISLSKFCLAKFPEGLSGGNGDSQEKIYIDMGTGNKVIFLRA